MRDACDHDLGAPDNYRAEDDIQHNPTVGDGTEAVKQFVQKIGLLNVMQAVPPDAVNKRPMN